MATERGAIHKAAPSTIAVSAKAFEDAMFELDGATEYQNWLIFGDSGAGKTVLAGSLPGRLLFLAGEPGFVSAAMQGAKGKVRLIPDPATATAALSWLEDGRASQYDWIILDGLSTLNKKFLLEYCREAWERNPAHRVGPNLPDKPDYLNAQNFTMWLVSRLVDLPCNLMITAHAMRPEGDEGEALVYPAIQGKGYEVSNYVSGLMHVVGYMAVRTKGGRKVRRVLFESWHDEEHDTRYFAKDQLGGALGFAQDIGTPGKPGSGLLMPDLLGMVDAPKPTRMRTRKVR